MSFLLRRAIQQSLAVSPVIADIFSIDLFSGAQTVVNGLDYTTNDALCWGKSRGATGDHQLYDTLRGATKEISSNLPDAEITDATGLTSFNNNGFTVGTSFPGTQVVWSFLKAARFFDVLNVTKTTSTQAFSHALGKDVGMASVKRLDAAGDWFVWHTTFASDDYILLNSIAVKQTAASNRWNNASPTSTQITLGSDFPNGDYSILLYANDTATDGVIQHGEYTGNGSTTGPVINLGWRPQYIMIKAAGAATGGWFIYDTARGILSPGNDQSLFANTINAEGSSDLIGLTATGFELTSAATTINGSGSSYIFMAIREA